MDKIVKFETWARELPIVKQLHDWTALYEVVSNGDEETVVLTLPPVYAMPTTGYIWFCPSVNWMPGPNPGAPILKVRRPDYPQWPMRLRSKMTGRTDKPGVSFTQFIPFKLNVPGVWTAEIEGLMPEIDLAVVV